MQSLRRARGIATRIWRGRGTGVVGVWVLLEWGFFFSAKMGMIGWGGYVISRKACMVYDRMRGRQGGLFRV
jgi:hypothetical protein